MKNGYIGLWLLLSLALMIVLTVAYSDAISIGGYTVKQAPFREALLKDKEADAREAMTLDSTLQANREAMQKKTSEVDSLPQSLLILGDSMTFNLSFRLAQYAKANGHTIHSVNWDSSNTMKWATSGHLKEFLDEYQPTFVFICLGSNELTIRDPKARLKHVTSLLEQLGDLPYVWIGPPNWKEDTGFNDYMEALCRPGSFFRSEGIKLERKKDGIHPTREASVVWMDSIARWIPKSAHPILMSTPPDTIGKVDNNLKYMGARVK